ncbi:MAG: lipoate--protein ligase [Synergistaceae bacterium]|nr:lipoate--protein ligase [Synergistaceae bacterium]
MIRYLQSPSADPYWNLALEQVLFDTLRENDSCFMFWQNDNAVIIGKYQNTLAEINAAFVKEQGIKVARRLSGGGAVYHDMGNLNFTFIVNCGEPNFDFSIYCGPIIRALRSLGVAAELSGRNDITIDGVKCSGNAQYYRKGRLMHHGAILFDSNLDMLAGALNVPADKIKSKGIPSTPSRVTNIKPHLRESATIEKFRDCLKEFLFQDNEGRMTESELQSTELEAAKTLRDTKYALWDWNYGSSPAGSIRKKRRIEGCGTIEAYMDVEKYTISRLAFHGDYFSHEDSNLLAEQLVGRPLEEEALRQRLAGLCISNYFHNLSEEQLISLLLC